MTVLEIRPWIGSTASVAQVRILRDLRIVNLTLGHGQFGMGVPKIDHLPLRSDSIRLGPWTPTLGSL